MTCSAMNDDSCDAMLLKKMNEVAEFVNGKWKKISIEIDPSDIFRVHYRKSHIFDSQSHSEISFKVQDFRGCHSNGVNQVIIYLDHAKIYIERFSGEFLKVIFTDLSEEIDDE